MLVASKPHLEAASVGSSVASHTRPVRLNVGIPLLTLARLNCGLTGSDSSSNSPFNKFSIIRDQSGI